MKWTPLDSLEYESQPGKYSIPVSYNIVWVSLYTELP